MKLCILVAVADPALIPSLRRLNDTPGSEVSMFLYNDGALLINDPSFLTLAQGMKATVCGVRADERHVPKHAAVTYGSLYNLSRMIAQSDRLISLTRAS